MMETQNQPPEPTPQPTKNSNLKWIVLAVGGGIVLIACIAVLAALAVAYFAPMFRKSSSANSGNPNIATQVTTSPQSQVLNVVMPPVRDHPQANGNKMGDPNAPVKIIEYADFQCTYCLRYWTDTEQQIIENYVATGKVYYEYRSVGGFIGPESADAANAAYCAADQNKFWEYHDTLFANWTGENAGDFTPDRLRQYAAAIHLNLDQFNTCLNSGAHTAQVSQDVSDAKTAGVQGTPAFIINGKLLEGAEPYSVFQQTIDAALNGQ